MVADFKNNSPNTNPTHDEVTKWLKCNIAIECLKLRIFILLPESILSIYVIINITENEIGSVCTVGETTVDERSV